MQHTTRPVCIYLLQQTSQQQSTNISTITMAPNRGASTASKAVQDDKCDMKEYYLSIQYQIVTIYAQRFRLTCGYSRPIVKPPIIDVVEVPITNALSSVRRSSEESKCHSVPLRNVKDRRNNASGLQGGIRHNIKGQSYKNK